MVTHLLCLCSLLIAVIKAYKREWNYPRTIWASNEYPDKFPSAMIFNLNDEFLIDGIEASEKYYYMYNSSSSVPDSEPLSDKPIKAEHFNPAVIVNFENGTRGVKILEPKELILKVKVTTPISKYVEASHNPPNPARNNGSDLMITVD